MRPEKIKEKSREECARCKRYVLRSKLICGNIITAINSKTVPVITYGAGIIGGTKAELERLDRKTRRLLTVSGMHDPKADVDRLHLRSTEIERALIGVENCV